MLLPLLSLRLRLRLRLRSSRELFLLAKCSESEKRESMYRWHFSFW